MKTPLLFIPTISFAALTCVLLATAPALADDCLVNVTKVAKPLVSVALEAANVCKNLPGLNQTRSIGLPVFKACLSPDSVNASGRLSVTCGTPEGALFKSQVSEDVDFRFALLVGECRFQTVEVRPAGTLGQSVARVMNLQRRLEKSLEKKIGVFCR